MPYERGFFMKYDVIIVGAGPAGIFTALEMIKKGSKKSILMIDKGKDVKKRSCPKAKTNHCVNCKPTVTLPLVFQAQVLF